MTVISSISLSRKKQDCTHRQNFDSSFGKTDFEDIDGLVSYRVLNMTY